jgi:uroporphyrinogen III methyltransferase / synthase
VTRPSEQGESLADRLRALGAEVLVAPTIIVEPAPDDGPLDQAILDSAEGRFGWIAFTSAAGVTAWEARSVVLEAPPPRARIAAVGDATAEALRGARMPPDLVPPTFTTAALAESFPEGRGRVLLPRADLATSDLEDGLRSKGWTVVRVDAYRVLPADALPPKAVEALAEGRVDAVTFTSPSTVHGFVRLAGVPTGVAVVCIGPVTAAAAEAAGFVVDAVADPHTTEGLVAVVAQTLV